MKKLILVLFLSTAAFAAFSFPADSSQVSWKKGVKYKKHEVKAGETWYEIAKQNNIMLSTLRLANKDAGNILSPGQIILIPPPPKAGDPSLQKNHTDKNTGNKTSNVKPDPKAKDKIGLQKTHVVKAKETLFSISKNYGIKVDDLKKWNKIGPEGLHPGDQLFVSAPKLPVREKTTPKEITATKPAAHPIHLDTFSTVAPKPQTEVAPVKITEVTPTVEPTIVSGVKDTSKSKNTGYVFAKGRKQVIEQGVASWIEDQDFNANKYYALHRTAPKGTIIKITNRMNQKSVFVKVIGVLPETGDNEGLLIKISKASADKLGVLDRRFQADLVYGL